MGHEGHTTIAVLMRGYSTQHALPRATCQPWATVCSCRCSVHSKPLLTVLAAGSWYLPTQRYGGLLSSLSTLRAPLPFCHLRLTARSATCGRVAPPATPAPAPCLTVTLPCTHPAPCPASPAFPSPCPAPRSLHPVLHLQLLAGPVRRPLAPRLPLRRLLQRHPAGEGAAGRQGRRSL